MLAVVSGSYDDVDRGRIDGMLTRGEWSALMSGVTFTNQFGVTITGSPEKTEKLLAIGLTQAELVALLTGTFDSVNIEHITAARAREPGALTRST